MADKLVFNESDGTVSDALFIQLDRAIEPNITLHLSQSICMLTATSKNTISIAITCKY